MTVVMDRSLATGFKPVAKESRNEKSHCNLAQKTI